MYSLAGRKASQSAVTGFPALQKVHSQRPNYELYNANYGLYAANYGHWQWNIFLQRITRQWSDA